MSKKISIAIDAMGGDNSPEKTIAGIKIFLDNNKSKDDFILNVFGREKDIKEKINKLNIISDRINIINSNTVVSDEETPLTAVKNSKNTSMWNCIQHQLDGKSDISLSAGNTGVLLVISRMILKMMNELNKPALAGLWPNQNGMNVVLDLGANIECNDQNLVDFAELGSALYKSLYPNEKPKVSLLNIGSEEIKGTEMLKTASKRLKELSSDDNFIYKGYIEGNNIMNGETNVIITDGFTGNIALKTAEGTAKFITKNLKKALTENLISKFSLIFSYFSLKKFKNKLDPRKYNGAIFLGLNGPVVKSHGGIDSLGFYHSIDLCYKIVRGNLMSEIRKNLNKKDLINNLSISTGLSKNLSKKIVTDLILIMINNLKEGGLILKNIGSFKIINKKQRLGRNPKTKEEFLISARRAVSFTPSKNITEYLKKTL